MSLSTIIQTAFDASNAQSRMTNAHRFFVRFGIFIARLNLPFHDL